MKIILILSKSFQRYGCKSLHTTRVNYSASLVRMKKLQADFQVEDGKPVWLKRGASDKILSSTTFFLCYVGILMSLAVIYDNAKPPSWKECKTC